MQPIFHHPDGLYCPQAGAFIDPLVPVKRALLTHAHADHLRPGSDAYWCAAPAEALVRRRAGPDATIHPVPYGKAIPIGRLTVSWHPAGHMLGSAQIRVEHRDAVWVVSGDYKRAADPTCAPFETVPCDVFVSEATFGLPIFRWPDPEAVVDEIIAWWRAGAAEGRPSALFAYAYGKSQRILGHLARRALPGPIWLHGAVQGGVDAYRAAGVALADTAGLVVDAEPADLKRALVLAPVSAGGSPWMKRLKRAQTGFASGWMRIRGNRRRKGYDRGFLLSDHADWPALLRTIEESGARRIRFWPGHGEALGDLLRERGRDAGPLERWPGRDPLTPSPPDRPSEVA